jgi:hypothetical protein
MAVPLTGRVQISAPCVTKGCEANEASPKEANKELALQHRECPGNPWAQTLSNRTFSNCRSGILAIPDASKSTARGDPEDRGGRGERLGVDLA